MIWIIVSNTNTCTLYLYQKKPAQLTFLKKISHPEFKEKSSEWLTTDKPGRQKSNREGSVAFSPRNDPKEVEFEKFSREIANEIDHGRTTGLFDQLIVIAEPHMYGLLMQQFNKQVKSLIIHNIQKDILYMKDHELLNFIKEYIQYPDKV